jgi:hypothetical protein
LFVDSTPPCPPATTSSTPSKVISFHCLLTLFFFIAISPPIADLIRHGKQHRAKPQEKPNAGHDHDQYRSTSQPLNFNANDNMEAAKIIVDEERETSAKLPSYKGLENFKLLEKMGECVSIHPTPPLSTSLIVTSKWGLFTCLQSG